MGHRGGCLPQGSVCVQQRGLDIWDAWSFFKTLDLDQSGEVDIEEFLLGCLRAPWLGTNGWF